MTSAKVIRRFKKNDEYDAYAVATVLINQLNNLPDAKPEDNHWTLSQLVNRRDILVKDGFRLKNGLHEQVSIAYPSYHQFFCEIDPKRRYIFGKLILRLAVCRIKQLMICMVSLEK